MNHLRALVAALEEVDLAALSALFSVYNVYIREFKYRIFVEVTLVMGNKRRTVAVCSCEVQ